MRACWFALLFFWGPFHPFIPRLKYTMWCFLNRYLGFQIEKYITKQQKKYINEIYDKWEKERERRKKINNKSVKIKLKNLYHRNKSIRTVPYSYF